MVNKEGPPTHPPMTTTVYVPFTRMAAQSSVPHGIAPFMDASWCGSDCVRVDCGGTHDMDNDTPLSSAEGRTV